MAIHFIQTSFKTAQDNMAFDLKMAQTYSGLWIRLYRWQTPGITYPDGRANRADTWGIDHSARPSGGGVLFHTPNALVIGIAADLDDPNFPKPIKDKLKTVTRWIANGLQKMDIPVTSYCTSDSTHSDQDTAYCNTYHNPYELQYESQKVTALAVRRWKNRFLIQGIIHTQSNYDSFSHVADPKHLSLGLRFRQDQIDRLESELITGATKAFSQDRFFILDQ